MTYNPSDFPHLAEDEWATVERMVQSLGPRAVEVVLTTLSEPEQHASLFAFSQREEQTVHAAAEESRREVEAARKIADEARQQAADAVRQSSGLQKQLKADHHRPWWWNSERLLRVHRIVKNSNLTLQSIVEVTGSHFCDG